MVAPTAAVALWRPPAALLLSLLGLTGSFIRTALACCCHLSSGGVVLLGLQMCVLGSLSTVEGIRNGELSAVSLARGRPTHETTRQDQQKQA